MTNVHLRSKMDCYLLFLSFQDDLSFALYLGHLPSWQLFERLLFLISTAAFCIRDFQRLGHRNELVNKIFMTQ